jgi:hypothetical protein
MSVYVRSIMNGQRIRLRAVGKLYKANNVPVQHDPTITETKSFSPINIMEFV